MKYNYKIIIAYDGGRYNGWQKQKLADNTIQKMIEDALSTITGEDIRIIGAGRTDSGVHAYEQVANFYISQSLEEDAVLAYMNKELPADIKVLTLKQAGERFHSRFNAISKEYIYYMDTRDKADVFKRKYSWHIAGELDCKRMRQAAKHLIGTHNFQSFTSDKRKNKSYIRKIHDIVIIEQKDKISISVHGNGFLHNMVRIIVGTLVEVGLKERCPDDIREILEVKNREAAGKTAPPHGLFLNKIQY